LIESRFPFARVLRKLALQAGKVLVRHPTPEALTAYDAGTLPPEQAEQIREHFVHCRECPELLLDYQTFVAARKGPFGRRDADLAQAWQELRRRMEPKPAPRRTSPALLTARTFCLLFLVATVGLMLWVFNLYSEVRRLGQPQVNLPVESLAAAFHPDGGWVRRISVPADAERFLLILSPAENRGDAECRLEIRAADGRFLWASGPLKRAGDGSYSLGLSRSFLPTGEYRIRLVWKAGAKEMLEEFPVVLLYAQAPAKAGLW
jgi:hypothetical protein